jgi:hypothetical protein
MLREATVELTKEYVDAAQQTANRQLALAGHRLLQRLNELLPKK